MEMGGVQRTKKSAKSSRYTFGLELSQINVANVIIYETRHKTEKP